MTRSDAPRRSGPLVLFLAMIMLLTAVPSAEAQEPGPDAPVPEEASTQITGGTRISEGEFPFLASVLFEFAPGEFEQGCGGTLIAPRWVLTARHCFDGGVRAAEVRVGLGSRDLRTAVQTIDVVRIVRHPTGPIMDVALLELAEGADTLHPRIDTIDYTLRSVVPGFGATATVIGWGDTDVSADGSRYPNIALKADIVTERCDNRIERESDAKNICGWGTENRDACFGDSGGPLVAEVDGVTTLIATVESGPLDGTCGLTPYGIYHRVSRHHRWIQSAMAGGARCDGKLVTINLNTNGGFGVGTASDDVILGTPGPDIIVGGAGNDTICGGDGDDRIGAGVGDDRVLAGPGADTVLGGLGDDTIVGGQGSDRLVGGFGADNLRGNSGDDELFGGADDDVLGGDGGNDVLSGHRGNDVLAGNEGDDRLFGGQGDDDLAGGRGNDRVFGSFGTDTCGDAADVLRGCEL